jgi:Nucleotidyltransferase domain
MFLSEDFISALVAAIDTDDYVGILLGGSYARGDATEWSDVDIACIVPNDSQLQHKRFVYLNGKLVSIGVKSIEGIRAQLSKPDSAIWVAPGIGDCRVLLDKDGSVAALLDEVRAFTWEPLREAANHSASFGLVPAVEMAQKVANELGKEDDLAVSYATAKLFAELTLTVAVARGVLIKSDNTYYHQVEEASGPDWARLHRTISGAKGPIPVHDQALACLRLYRETLALLRPIMLPEHLEVVEQSMRKLEEGGLVDS